MTEKLDESSVLSPTIPKFNNKELGECYGNLKFLEDVNVTDLFKNYHVQTACTCVFERRNERQVPFLIPNADVTRVQDLYHVLDVCVGEL